MGVFRPESGSTRFGEAQKVWLNLFAILLPDRAALGRFVRHLGAIGERAGASDHLVSEALYLVEWELVVPSMEDAKQTARSLRAAGHPVAEAGERFRVQDPWGTTLRIGPVGRRRVRK